MDFTRGDYRKTIVYAACFLAAVMVVCGVGILSNVGSHAVDAVLADNAPAQAQTAKVAVVGMFNKVTVGQTQETTQAGQPAERSGGLFGLTSTDYAILAVFMAILAVFVVTVGGAWLFFNPKGW